MKATAFGLDIGTTSIKVVSLKKEKDGFELEAVASSPSTVKGILSEAGVDQKLLGETVKKLVTDANIKSQIVNISIPENQVYSRIIEMPQLSEQEVAAALKWELEQYIPLPIDQVRTDWQILENVEKNGEKKISVLIVAAPNTLIEKYERVMEYAQLSINSIETEVLSVQRALDPLTHTPEPNIIVQLGAATTDFAVVKNGIAQLTSYTNIGGIAITRAVSVDLGVDISQAEDLKRAYGLSQDVFEGKIGQSLNPILASLTTEIKKTMLLYKEKTGTEIKQVILSGGSALLPGLDVYLTNNLGIQVVLGNCWRLQNVKNVPPEIASYAPTYSVVVGLALRDL